MSTTDILTSGIMHPNEFSLISGNTNIIKDLKSVQQSIRLLLTTAKGELFGDPNFGCNLYSYLFDYDGEVLYQMIKDDIVNTLTEQETRVLVSVSDITISSNESKKTLNINIKYSIRYTDYRDEYDLIISKRKEEEF